MSPAVEENDDHSFVLPSFVLGKQQTAHFLCVLTKTTGPWRCTSTSEQPGGWCARCHKKAVIYCFP